jgi:hypothetical protein
MKFDFEKQPFIVKKFHETQRIIKVQRAWRTKYKFIDAPRANAIKSIVSRFEKTGSTEKKPPKRLEPTILRKQAIIDVENQVSEFPKLSLKMISGGLYVGSAKSVVSATQSLVLKHLCSKCC